MKQILTLALCMVAPLTISSFQAHAKSYTIQDARVLRCSFTGPKKQAHSFVADIDPENKLYGGFKYIVDQAKVLHFSSHYVTHFTYDGKTLDAAADAKNKDGAITIHLGPKSDPKNAIVWTNGKDRFEAHPSMEACQVARP